MPEARSAKRSVPVKPVCTHPLRPDAKQCRNCPLRVAREATGGARKVTVNRAAASAPRSPGASKGGAKKAQGKPRHTVAKTILTFAAMGAICVGFDAFAHSLAQPGIPSRPSGMNRVTRSCPAQDLIVDGPMAGTCMPGTQDIGPQGACKVTKVLTPEDQRERAQERLKRREGDRIEDQEKRDKRHDFKFMTPARVGCPGPVESLPRGDSAQGAAGGGGN